jgi:hypothetical protein
MKCLNCNEEFTPLSVTQMYCCRKCGDTYRRTHDIKALHPSITFSCSCCGKTVVTEEGKDMRTRFCSETCEKKYWKHPIKKSALRNFSSLSQYKAYESWSNDL